MLVTGVAGSLPALSSGVKQSKKKTGNRWKSFYVGDGVGCHWSPRRVEKTSCWTEFATETWGLVGVGWGEREDINFSFLFVGHICDTGEKSCAPPPTIVAAANMLANVPDACYVFDRAS